MIYATIAYCSDTFTSSSFYMTYFLRLWTCFITEWVFLPPNNSKSSSWSSRTFLRSERLMKPELVWSTCANTVLTNSSVIGRSKVISWIEAAFLMADTTCYSSIRPWSTCSNACITDSIMYTFYGRDTISSSSMTNMCYFSSCFSLWILPLSPILLTHSYTSILLLSLNASAIACLVILPELRVSEWAKMRWVREEMS